MGDRPRWPQAGRPTREDHAGAARPPAAALGPLLALIAGLPLGASAVAIGLGPAEALPLPLSQQMVAARPWFACHALAAGLFLLLVPALLWPRLRRPPGRSVHARLGWLGAALVVLAALTALPVALASPAGVPSLVLFGLLAAWWLVALGAGLAAARRGDRAGHRRWMIRVVALTFGAVLLRWLQNVPLALGLVGTAAYIVTALSAWGVAAGLGEALIRSRDGRLRRGRPAFPNRSTSAGDGASSGHHQGGPAC